VRAARTRREAQTLGGGVTGPAATVAAFVRGIDGPQWGALGVIAAGIATGFTRLRGTWFGRLVMPLAVLAYLGFGAGALLSQAQFWGWAQADVPRGAVVLLALAVAILTAAWHLPLGLVDIEPFDAYLPTVACVAALDIFSVSLAVSCVVPMAYCRYGCPTGALLDHLRLHGRADRLTWWDGVMLACLAAAGAAYWRPS
jgi:NosR/NirI family nitrous oxide reductase transcriptional regulator